MVVLILHARCLSSVSRGSLSHDLIAVPILQMRRLRWGSNSDCVRCLHQVVCWVLGFPRWSDSILLDLDLGDCCRRFPASCAVEVQGRWHYQMLPKAASSYEPSTVVSFLGCSSGKRHELALSPLHKERQHSVAHGYLASNNGTSHRPGWL